MAAERPQKTLADYVAIAISPVLIMALVGSLVFFLLEVLYVGQYHGRLQWVLFFFVFGAVLIARVSMTSDIANRAGMYGFTLGLLVWIALLVYVEYPPGSRFANVGWLINLALIAIIWWSAHRLTWDCTLIDDTKDASGAGLLQAASLEQPTPPAPAPQETPKEDGKRKKEPQGLAGWWHRYRRYREEQGQRPHSPGVWVVYFSLAALPLFGLGQMLISANTTRTAAQKASAQSYSFTLMVIYVASGMGLLLTTSFLNLRRYLRQRGVHMPAAVTSAWLLIGALLIVALLSVGAFLPRPSGDFQGFLEWTGVRSPQRKASSQARDGDGTGKDKGRGAADKQKDKDSKGSGRDAKGKEEGGEGSDKGKSDDKKGGGEKSGRDKGEKGDGEGEGGQDGEQRADDSSFPDLRLSDEAANVLKWIVIILAVLVVLYFLFRSGLRWLANFTDWARRLLEALRAFWEGLWGGGKSAGQTGAAETVKARPPKPFAAYRDPFGRGAADDMTPAELVQYSFEALEAWARERHLKRQVSETALEFSERVGDEFPVLEEDARRLALLYAGLAYAGGSFPAEGRAELRRFWQILMDATERPLSAGVG
ncbi:MAG: DUF4129 domain-containing protein [Gemmataceae bacterium]|nr:DUF4129 domain-containing protein [Gemmataceae bacterium]